MYFVQEGIVRIVKEVLNFNKIVNGIELQFFILKENGHEQDLSRVDKGGYFGELALITKKPRAATVYAASPEVKTACKYF